MTPTSEQTAEERRIYSKLEQLYNLGYSRPQYLSQDDKASAALTEELAKEFTSLRLTNQRLEEENKLVSEQRDLLVAEVERMKETIGEMANRAVQLIGSSTCDKHTQAIKEMPFDEFIAWHKSLPCFYCMETRLRDLART